VVTGLNGDDVLSLHLMNFHEQWLVRQIIREANWVVAHSASLMAQAERIVGKLGAARCHIPYGVDCERLRIKPDVTARSSLRYRVPMF